LDKISFCKEKFQLRSFSFLEFYQMRSRIIPFFKRFTDFLASVVRRSHPLGIFDYREGRTSMLEKSSVYFFREMTGQVHALNHLKACRGGPYVPNPGK